MVGCVGAFLVTELILPEEFESGFVLKIGKLHFLDEQWIEPLGETTSIVVNQPFKQRIKNSLGIERDADKIEYNAVPSENSVATFRVFGRSAQEAFNIAKFLDDEIVKRHDNLFQGGLAAARTTLKQLEDQLEKLAAELERSKKLLSSLESNPGINAPAVILLESNIHSKERNLTDLIHSRNTLKFHLSSISTYPTQVLEAPFLPEERSAPNTLLNVAATAVLITALWVLLLFGISRTEGENGIEVSEDSD